MLTIIIKNISERQKSVPVDVEMEAKNAAVLSFTKTAMKNICRQIKGAELCLIIPLVAKIRFANSCNFL